MKTYLLFIKHGLGRGLTLIGEYETLEAAEEAKRSYYKGEEECSIFYGRWIEND